MSSIDFGSSPILTDEQNVGHRQVRFGEEQKTFALGRPGEGSEKVDLSPLDGCEDIGPGGVGDRPELDPQLLAHDRQKVRCDAPGDLGGVEELEWREHRVGGVPDGAVGGDEGAFLGGKRIGGRSASFSTNGNIATERKTATRSIFGRKRRRTRMRSTSLRPGNPNNGIQIVRKHHRMLSAYSSRVISFPT